MCVCKQNTWKEFVRKENKALLPYKFVRVWCCLKCNCATIHFPASNGNVFYNLLFFTYCRPTTRQTCDFVIASSNGNHPLLYRIHIGNVAKCIDLCLWKHAVFVVVAAVVTRFFFPFLSSIVSNHPSTRCLWCFFFSFSSFCCHLISWIRVGSIVWTLNTFQLTCMELVLNVYMYPHSHWNSHFSAAQQLQLEQQNS